MKYLVFILVLAISAQPLQAVSCDMNQDKAKAPEMSHHMKSTVKSGHDCCDPDSSDSPEGCHGGMDCGACFLSVSVLPRLTVVQVHWTPAFYPDYSAENVLPSHSSPPFRPPIA